MTEDVKREIDILCNFLKNCKSNKQNFTVNFNTMGIGTSRNYFYGETLSILYPSKEIEILNFFQNGYSVSIDLFNIEEIGHTIDEDIKVTFFIQFKNISGWILIMEE